MRASVHWWRSLRRFAIFLWSSLGSCPCCIRGAFRAAFGSWVLAGVGQATSTASLLVTLSIAAAFILTALWLAHLLAYALKVSIPGRAKVKASAHREPISRRNVIPIFARALATIAVATSIPTVVLAQCNEEAATRCHAVAADCRSKCDRTFHREEASHACHQECYGNEAKCKADARCT